MTLNSYINFFNRTHDADDTNVADRETWTSCLKLATLWNIDRMRKKAISMLDKFEWDPIDKIVVAKQNNVSRWLIEEYVKVLRTQSFTVDDVLRLEHRIGIETICILLAVRQRKLDTIIQDYGYLEARYLPGHMKRSDFTVDVREAFEGELKKDKEYEP